jgi:hypothetical protein
MPAHGNPLQKEETMNKELVIAGVLLSISTVLKICSVVAICSADLRHPSELHDHQEIILEQKKQAQTSGKPVV